MDTRIYQAIENSLQGSLLVETDICVSITVLDTNDVVGDIEIIRLPRIGNICGVLASEFLYRTEYRVSATCAKPWMQ